MIKPIVLAKCQGIDSSLTTIRLSNRSDNSTPVVSKVVSFFPSISDQIMIQLSTLANIYFFKLINMYNGSDSQESACNAGDSGLSPGSGRSPGERNGYPFQCSCLENPMDRGAWQATVHGVPKSWT